MKTFEITQDGLSLCWTVVLKQDGVDTKRRRFDDFRDALDAGLSFVKKHHNHGYVIFRCGGQWAVHLLNFDNRTPLDHVAIYFYATFSEAHAKAQEWMDAPWLYKKEGV